MGNYTGNLVSSEDILIVPSGGGRTIGRLSPALLAKIAKAATPGAPGMKGDTGKKGDPGPQGPAGPPGPSAGLSGVTLGSGPPPIDGSILTLLYKDTDLSSGFKYVNLGTVAVPDWDLL